MSKVKIIYDLPEERMEFLQAVYGDRLAGVIWEFMNNGHRDYKYDDPENLYDGIMEAKKIIARLLEDEGIDIESIYS